MANPLSRWWKYTVMRANVRFEERADPKVQLEQAIADAQDQHRRLREQAANVIANQRQTEMRLNRSLEELERVNGNARQALRMASDADRSGDAKRAAEYEQAAESFATRMLALETEIQDLRGVYLDATNGATQAKAAVEQNAAALKAKLAERQQLLSRLDQAELQEQVNRAMTTLSESGGDVPSFDEVRQKIDARYARAKGMAELTDATSQSRMLEIEQATKNLAAQARLAELRQELGLRSRSDDPLHKELGP